METIKQKILRSPRTWTDNILLTYLLAYMWMNVGVLISIISCIGKTCDLFTSDPDVSTFMGTYSDFFGIWPAFIFAILIFKGNRPMMKLFLPDKKSRIFKGWAIGIAVGFVMNSINVVGSILMGDLKLLYNGIEILPLIGFAFFIFIQSGADDDRLDILNTVHQIILPVSVELRQHVIQKQNRLIVSFRLIESNLKVANVVSVDGADVMKSEFFKQRAADKSFFNCVFQIVQTAM